MVRFNIFIYFLIVDQMLKFIKMAKTGVPIMAVKHKMGIEGLNPDELDVFYFI